MTEMRARVSEWARGKTRRKRETTRASGRGASTWLCGVGPVRARRGDGLLAQRRAPRRLWHSMCRLAQRHVERLETAQEKGAKHAEAGLV
eukprot:951718-Pleurochrysis_carterae.AAC.1